MKKKIKIFGLRRSGNHVIIEWILSHFSKGLHINDNDKNSRWVWENDVLIKSNKEIDYDILIESYEDVIPEKIDENTFIILRDWYNICSSRYISKRGWENSCKNQNCVDVYTHYCNLYYNNKSNFILYNFLMEDDIYVKKVEKQLNLSEHKKIPNTLPKSKIGGGSSFNNLNKLNRRYINLIENHKNEWNKIKSFKVINQHMENIFNIKI